MATVAAAANNYNNIAVSYKRTVLITGATDGIGRAVALELSARREENFVIVIIQICVGLTHLLSK